MTDDSAAAPSDKVFEYTVPAPAHVRRRRDPDRRGRIIDAAIAVIEEVGVAGTTMRLVAKKAEVPLGSLTYHFADREELLRAAFERFDEVVVSGMIADLRAAKSAEQLLDVVARVICGPSDRRTLLLTLELFAYASRREDMRPFVEKVLERTRREFMRFFSPCAAAALDALLEGAYIHRTFEQTPVTFREARILLRRLAGA